MSTPYERMVQFKKEAGLKVPDVLVLAQQNDPFYVGTRNDLIKARWFADLWERYGYTTGVHLRRAHYRHVSQPNPTDHNGSPYENTEVCWERLCEAGKYARHLGLVDPNAFVDRRNPEPRIFMFEKEEEPGWDYFLPEWKLPEINTELKTELDTPNYWTNGYEYEDALQPYHVEVWCEKSTMDGELLPLCERHAANLVTGVGEMSITSVVGLLNRVRQLGKPCRILYVSDFDPAGASMPVAVARKIEYGILDYEGSADANVRLDPLILTAEQTRDYGLPRQPIKKEEKRKDRFEAIHGEGAVELDALEALHPGEFARIVEEAIRHYRDPDLWSKAVDRENEADEALEEAVADALEAPTTELETIREEVAEIASGYSERLAALNAELQAELEPYRARVDDLRQAITDEMESLEPDLPEMPEAETQPESDDWLYDSARGYVYQLAKYKKAQGKEMNF